jgi:hypothetical protein
MQNPYLPKEDMSADVFMLWEHIENENDGYLVMMLDRIQDLKRQAEGVITLEFYQLVEPDRAERLQKVHRVFYTMLDGTFENGIYEALIKMNAKLQSFRNHPPEGAV